MDNKSVQGKVQTVLGLVDSNKLGFTITHEHLLMDMSILVPKFVTLLFRKIARNMKKTNVDDAIHEAILFKKAGGNTIVDVTPRHIRFDTQVLVRIAKETGINIVMGTAYYIEPTLPRDMNNKTIEDIANEYINDITKGFDDTGIRAGIIGEIGCSWPITENEIKSLKAAAIAQKETGVPISIHSAFHPDAPFEILIILTEAGADPERIILGHMEFAFSNEARLKFADLGCHIQFDSLGVSDTVFKRSGCKITTDVQRVDQIKELIEHGHLGQILVSHDFCTNDCMTYTGGPGYIHIPTKILPLMKEKGLSDAQIHTITVDNPAHILSIT
ncbi:hypothetical protein [Clostridium sp. BJN0013]|uniref:phosphotriesterase family protein n=1 Tax=Clostridium sp. BJN0013 TaxID=3236840 RepID=UPI0034C68F23